MSNIDFGDINGANLSVVGLRIPAPLFSLLKANNVSAAERWMRAYDQHAALQPYRVTLYVQEHRFATDLKPVTYFIRGPRINPEIADSPFHRSGDQGFSGDPREVAEAADKLWTYWEKPRAQNGDAPSQFPDTVDVGDIMEIDLQDWHEYLCAAHRYARDSSKFLCIGPPRYPLYWTCVGMAFVDDQEAHQHEHYETLDAFARMPGYDTRGNIIT